jgi:hypothetical protein
MASPAARLAAALRERRALIGDDKSRREQAQHIHRLRLVSEKILELQAQLPPPIDPQLAHFLARCSYDKAADFLEATEKA